MGVRDIYLQLANRPATHHVAGELCVLWASGEEAEMPLAFSVAVLCQKFARNCATRNLTSPHHAAIGSMAHLGVCEET